LPRFVTTAGILAHYVGDACQPLHCSIHYNGVVDENQDKRDWVGTGVHSAYETNMLDANSAKLMGLVDGYSTNKTWPKDFKGGKSACECTVELILFSSGLIPPVELCQFYGSIGQSGGHNSSNSGRHGNRGSDNAPRPEFHGGNHSSKPSAAAVKALWGKYGDKTSQVLAQGAITLSHIWEMAWKEGNGSQISFDGRQIPNEDIQDLYLDKNFLKDYTIDEIGVVLGERPEVEG